MHHDLNHLSPEKTYDATQTGYTHPVTGKSHEVHDKDTFTYNGGKSGGVQVSAWPVHCAGERCGVLHELDKGQSWKFYGGGKYKNSVDHVNSLFSHNESIGRPKYANEILSEAKAEYLIPEHHKKTCESWHNGGDMLTAATGAKPNKPLHHFFKGIADDANKCHQWITTHPAYKDGHPDHARHNKEFGGEVKKLESLKDYAKGQAEKHKI